MIFSVFIVMTWESSTMLIEFCYILLPFLVLVNKDIFLSHTSEHVLFFSERGSTDGER
jgi:cytochrome c oxidase subunit IV